jgi:hypothetical protein
MQFGCRFHVRAAIKDPFHNSARLHLARMMLQLVRERVGELGLSLHHFTKESRQNLREKDKDVGIETHCRRQSGADSGSVDEGQTFLRLKLKGLLNTSDPQCFDSGDFLSVPGHRSHVVPGSEETSNVGERHKIS